MTLSRKKPKWIPVFVWWLGLCIICSHLIFLLYLFRFDLTWNGPILGTSHFSERVFVVGGGDWHERFLWNRKIRGLWEVRFWFAKFVRALDIHVNKQWVSLQRGFLAAPMLTKCKILKLIKVLENEQVFKNSHSSGHKNSFF